MPNASARPRSSRKSLAGAGALVALVALGASLAVACSPKASETSRRQKAGSPAIQGAAPGSVTPPAGAIDYQSAVQPILKSSCGTSSCHGPGSVYSVYDADESVFLNEGKTVLARLAATDDTVMPKPGFGMTLTEAKAQTLKAYLAQHQVTAATDQVDGAEDGGAGDAGYDEDVTRPPSADVVKVCSKVSAEQKVSGLMLSYADVRPIGEAACGGGGCHSGALPRGFVAVESQWTHDTYGMGIVTNILNGGMPIGGRTISEADKSKMVSYICARKDF
jgi:hypothetical protein